MRGLVAEIQVRTTAQHIWATASHTLQYKQENSVPIPIRRAIHRVSALLETVDLEFERVLQERDEYRKGLEGAPQSEELNVDIIERVLDETLELDRKNRVEPYADLLWEMQQLGVTTRGKLADLIAKNGKDILSRDAEIVRQIVNDGPEANAYVSTDPARLARGFFFGHVGLVREMLETEFGEKYTPLRGTLRVLKGSGRAV